MEGLYQTSDRGVMFPFAIQVCYDRSCSRHVHLEVTHHHANTLLGEIYHSYRPLPVLESGISPMMGIGFYVILSRQLGVVAGFVRERGELEKFRQANTVGSGNSETMI